MKLIRNPKFLELLGLVLVFSAALLEWNQVASWNREKSDLERLVNSSMTNSKFKHVIQSLRMENAFTRAVGKFNYESKSHTNPLAQLRKDQWKSPEVRALWKKQARLYLDTINENVSLLRELYKKYDSKEPKSITVIEDNIKPIDLLVNTDSFNMETIPDITETQAIEYNKILLSCTSDATKEFEQILNLQEEQYSWWSTIYQFVFLLGSLLIVLSKFVDWRNN